MGRYVDWEDVIDRYPELNSIGGADQISSTYIVYAESYLDSILSTHYATPFSQEIMIVKDLAIDFTYWRAGRFKLENAVEVKSAFFETIDMLKSGQMIMVDNEGNEIPAASITGGIYATTQSYHSSFGFDDPVNWSPDSDYIDAIQDERL